MHVSIYDEKRFLCKNYRFQLFSLVDFKQPSDGSPEKVSRIPCFEADEHHELVLTLLNRCCQK